MVKKVTQDVAWAYFMVLSWLVVGFFLGLLAGFEAAPDNEPCEYQQSAMVCTLEPSDKCGYWGCYELGDCSTNRQGGEQ